MVVVVWMGHLWNRGKSGCTCLLELDYHARKEKLSGHPQTQQAPTMTSNTQMSNHTHTLCSKVREKSDRDREKRSGERPLKILLYRLSASLLI